MQIEQDSMKLNELTNTKLARTFVVRQIYAAFNKAEAMS